MQPCWKTGGENTCVWHFNRQFATLEEANFEVCGYSVLWIEGKICRESCGEWGEKWSIHYSKNDLLMMSLGKAFTKDDCYSSHSMGDLPTHRWNSCCSLQLHGRVWYITSCIIMYIYHLQSHASNANRLGETCSHIAAVLSCYTCRSKHTKHKANLEQQLVPPRHVHGFQLQLHFHFSSLNLAELKPAILKLTPPYSSQFIPHTCNCTCTNLTVLQWTTWLQWKQVKKQWKPSR